MHELEVKILHLFKRNTSKELSTSEIVKKVFDKEFIEIEAILMDPFVVKEKKKTWKQKKAKLHRRLLHHLHGLVKEEILIVNKEGKNGEKYFIPKLNEGEELIIGKYKRQIVLSKPANPSMQIEGYEQEGIITNFEGRNCFERMNSVMVECENFNTLEQLYKTMQICFNSINDVVALHNFESLFRYQSKELMGFLDNIAKDAEDFGKSISCMIDFRKLKNEEKGLKSLKEYFEQINSQKVSFILDLDAKILRNNSFFFHRFARILTQAKASLYIRNLNISSTPYFVGRAGPYTFSDKEWELYKKRLKGKMKVIGCGQSAIAIDLRKFFEKTKKISDLSDLTLKVVKTLLATNNIQRNHSDEYFKNIADINHPFSKEFFMFSKNHIRFWNYGWKDPNLDTDAIIKAIHKSKMIVDTFCIAEEIIYLSCGMPTRFKVAYSCAFKNFNEDKLKGAMFQKIVIKKLEDVYSDEIKNLISEKEEIFKIFDGGDRIRFHRTGIVQPKEIEREINVILNTYELPFFCYDFGGIRGNLKLTSFLDE